MGGGEEGRPDTGGGNGVEDGSEGRREAESGGVRVRREVERERRCDFLVSRAYCILDVMSS